MKKRILKTLLVATLLLSITTVAHAYEINKDFRPQNLPFSLSYTDQTPETSTIVVLQIIAGGLLYFAAPIAIIMIIIAGATMIIGGAETDQVEQSKKNLTWALVGLLVIILSYSIVRAILTFVIDSAQVPAIEAPKTEQVQQAP